ncbi:MAG: diacylglycerol kinase family protein [Acutalibacteraceae bacterium]|nr:diacylglycerol kinase family protein [Acutalibacteraceae bacterium]
MKSFLKGFLCAFQGLAECICTERNMRIHIVISLYVLYFSKYYSLSVEKFAILVIIMAVVLSLELLNTAVERACDAITKESHPLIKSAKDAAAGAVLVSAIASVVIGVLLFWDTDILWNIASSLCYSPEDLTVFILSLLVSTIFIVVGPTELVNSVTTVIELKQELEKENKKGKNKEDSNKNKEDKNK